MSSHRIVWLALPTVLAACATKTQSVSEGVFHRSETARVVDADGAHATTWDYLVDKYDADADGTVTAAEYDRGAEVFARHDRNGDGVLSFADYDPEEIKREREERQVADRGRAVLALYFQDDDDPNRMDVAELERALAVYDAAGDGAVTFDEFESNKEARRARGRAPSRSAARRLEEGDPYELLYLAVDADEDGSLTNAELVACFKGGADEHGVWDLEADRDGPGARPTAPEEGAPAPDFTLKRLNEEGTVTLSSFQGDRPVALVFGSYT